MLKTHMNNACLLHVQDREEGRVEQLADILFGEVLIDETCRYKKGFRVMTSPVIYNHNNEFKTQSGNLYITENTTESLTISASEWYVMRENLLSPLELVALKKLNQLDRLKMS